METARCVAGSAVCLLAVLLSSCSLPVGTPESQTRDHAYIEYWPPPEDGDRIRLAIKDVIDMKGAITTAGSKYLAENSAPALRDAPLLRHSRSEKVAIVGKTTLTELALGTSGVNEHYGSPVNPIAPWRIPGGSSSGSAVAVANGSADVAFGSDTAGSIRVPAACCGVYGLKTTFGLISLEGVYPLSPDHLDTIGPMAADVPKLVVGMELLTPGFTGRYEKVRANAGSAAGIKIARFYPKGTDPKIGWTIDRALSETGFEIVYLDQAFADQWKKAQENGTTVAVVDGWITNRDLAGKAGVGITTTAAIALGATRYPQPYGKALAERDQWQRTLKRVFEQVDFIALPTLKKFPPRKPLLFRRTALLETAVLGMQNTVAVNYAGNPAIAIPLPVMGRGFPVTSLQLIGRPRSEAELINAARLVAERNGQ